MTISEIEKLSGMTRANIRFYESEGLLSPAREPNGYRNYSQEDLEALRRIRLLRALRIPLEEVRALQDGQESLDRALDRHLAQLDRDRSELDKAREVCRSMLCDGADFASLDAQRYLDALEQGTADALREDVLPLVGSPFRRFFARAIDFVLYDALVDILLILGLNVNPTLLDNPQKLLVKLCSLLLMLFAEPMLLHFFGTTAGKGILGLSVQDVRGGRPSYGAGFYRTWGVFFRGEGLFIPIYHLYRNWKSFVACGEEELPWEDETTLVLRDTRRRTAAALAVYALLVAVSPCAMFLAELPRHRGDITLVEFCDNYNQLCSFLSPDSAYRLDQSGNWVDKDATRTGDRGYTLYLGGVPVMPDLEFTTEDGYVTGVHFRLELEGQRFPPAMTEEMAFLSMALVGAQKGPGFLSSRNTVYGTIGNSAYQDFALTQRGVSLRCQVEYSGYQDSVIGLYAEDEGSRYILDFSAEK